MLFIHSSTDEHLVCFYPLPIVNAAMTISVKSICLDPCFQYGKSVCSFFGTAKLFSTATVPFYICTINVPRLQFFHMLRVISYYLIENPNRCEV